jgi:transposase-like protein
MATPTLHSGQGRIFHHLRGRYRRLSQAGLMTPEPATYPGYRFPAEIISHAIWFYHVFSLSLRDVELILAERGITVTTRVSGSAA